MQGLLVISYRILKENLFLECVGNYATYGVEALQQTKDGEIIICRFGDVSVSKELVELLVDDMNQREVSIGDFKYTILSYIENDYHL